MVKYVHLDFETRSRCDIKKAGARVYSEHPSTEILCLAFKRNSDSTPVLLERDHILFMDREGEPDWSGRTSRLFDQASDPEVIFVAHNAAFERAIWTNIVVERYGFPEIPLERWRCTMASAFYHALPASLGHCAQVLELDKQKDEDGKNVMMKMCKPRKPTKTDYSEWHEKPEDFEILYSYCIDDVLTESAIHKKIGLLPPAEQKVWELDQVINDRGVEVDYDLAEAAIEVVKQEEAVLLEEFRRITGLSSPKSRIKYRTWLGQHGIKVESTKKDVLKNIVTKDPVARRAIDLGFEINKASTAKYAAMINMKAKDGRVHGLFQYHGATTGRWSGRGVQLQNLPRGYGDGKTQLNAINLVKTADRDQIVPFGNPMTLASDCIRGAIKAPKDKDLIVYDFAQIEARMLPWLAGDEKTLDIFRSGKDVYVDAAAGIYKVPYSEVTKDQRFVGKVATLALGYQGWSGAFMAMSEAYGLEMTEERAAEIAGAWRDSHPLIRSFWYKLEDCAIKAIRTGKVCKTGRIQMCVKGDFLKVLLPSGRLLHYYKPLLVNNDKKDKIAASYLGYNNKRQWCRILSYGGKWAENITQAASRDILVPAMFELERFEFPIVLHVHDEVGIEEDEGCPGSEEHIERILTKVPRWAKGLPLGADGFIGKRYRK